MGKETHKLTIEFDSEDLLLDFVAWMSDGGGECNFTEHESHPIFKYRKEDTSKAVSDPERYGPFLFGDERKIVVSMK
jgi:hypothetical protein